MTRRDCHAALSVFGVLMDVAGCTKAFVHDSNDVANANGPVDAELRWQNP